VNEMQEGEEQEGAYWRLELRNKLILVEGLGDKRDQLVNKAD
jgi:hypothetical protein